MDDVVAYRVDCVRDGSERGWSFTPLNGKIPTQKGWTQAEPSKQEDATLWAFDGNVGLRTGAVSGVVVLDEDENDAVLNFLGVIPDTPTVVTGSGKRHYYFRWPGYPVKNSAKKLFPGLDVRGDGGQVVFPGSIHPETGEPYYWLEDRAPWEIPMAELPEDITSKLNNGSPSTRVRSNNGSTGYAAKALLDESRRVSEAPEGSRNNTLNEAAFSLGQLVGSGDIDEAIVRQYLTRAAQDAGLTDETEIESTITSGIKGGRLKPRSGDSRGRPMTVIKEGEPEDVKDDGSVPVESVTDIRSPGYIPIPGQHITANGIIEQGNDAFVAEVFMKIPEGAIFRFMEEGGEIRGEPGEKKFRPLNATGAAILVDGYSKLCKWSEASRGRVRRDFVACNQGQLIVEASAGHEAIPKIDQICSYPMVIGEDMTMLKPGYDRTTKIYYDEPPTLRDMEIIQDENVIRETLDDLVIDFPFDSQASRENFYGLLLTCLIRPCVDNIPLHAAIASKERTGKSILIERVAGSIILGKNVPMAQPGHDDEEWQKVLLTQLQFMKTLICFDNVSQAIDSGYLSSVLTAEVIEGRILGKSELVTAKNTLIITATGNNMQGSGEVCKRTIPIILQSKLENPEDRNDFKHKFIKPYAMSQRRKVLGCLFGMIENWKAAGRPDGDLPLGGFDAWAATVGGIMKVHGFTSWLTNQKAWIRAANPDQSDLEDLFKEVVVRHGERKFVTAREMVKICEENGLFPQFLRGSTEASKLAGLSRGVLKKYLDGANGGYFLRTIGRDSQRYYYLEASLEKK